MSPQETILSSKNIRSSEFTYISYGIGGILTVVLPQLVTLINRSFLV
jgi:hypothetical protein